MSEYQEIKTRLKEIHKLLSNMGIDCQQEIDNINELLLDLEDLREKINCKHLRINGDHCADCGKPASEIPQVWRNQQEK